MKKERSSATTTAHWLHGNARYAVLLAGDIVAYYTTLILTLVLRYGADSFHGDVFFVHRYAFSIGLILWLIVFYIGGLYDRHIVVRKVLDRRFFALVGIGGLLLILLFYFVPSLGITPKTTLVIFVIFYAIIGYGWRMIFNSLVHTASGKGSVRVMIIGASVAADEVATSLSGNPAYGYVVVQWLKEGLQSFADPTKFLEDIRSHGIDLLVIPQNLEHDPGAVRVLYAALMSGTSIITLPDFYERIFEKVSLAILDEAWLIRNLSDRRPRYQAIRRVFEVFAAACILVVTSPLLLLVAFLIPLTSRGPIFYKQNRIGYDGRPFVLYKFRSMYNHIEKNPDAEQGSPTWSSGKSDPRITPLGRVLRASHIDELPQLALVIKGTLSFVGPRPERPEFTADLETKIPYYTLRYLVRPGIAGWAQLNYPYGASVEDAYQKLQYDIYYIKHRSFWLDLTIVLKTVKRVFIPAEASRLAEA